MNAASPGLQWRTILMGLPKERFTAQQLQRTLPQNASLSLWIAAWINVVLPVAGSLTFMAYHRQWWMVASAGVFSAGVVIAAARAWRDPSDRLAHGLYYGVPVTAGLLFGFHGSVLLKDPAATLHLPS